MIECTPKIGEVYLMNFSGSENEQNGWRPGVVFQNNKGNIFSPNIIALPLTTALKKLNQPTHVFVSSEGNGLKRDSIVLCENPERMSKKKIGFYITTLSDDIMAEIAEASILASSAISFMKPDALFSLWKRASSLNKSPELCIA